MVRVFANRKNNPLLCHTKDSEMVINAFLFNTQHYEVWIKGKMEQSRERSNALSYVSVL